MKKYKNIIFDLGGVLLNIDYLKTVQAFGKLGLINPEQAFSKEVQAELFRDLECGGITNSDFLATLKGHIPEANTSQIKEAWNALLLDFPVARFEFLKKLTADYHLFLLSNTNAIHLEKFRIIIDESVGWNSFNRLFKGIGYSHELNARKPDADIFHKMIAKYHLKPTETLFIDDTEMHVLTARSLGIEAIHLKNDEEITEVLKDLLRE